MKCNLCNEPILPDDLDPRSLDHGATVHRICAADHAGRTHGKKYAYQMGCRCQLCKQAHVSEVRSVNVRKWSRKSVATLRQDVVDHALAWAEDPSDGIARSRLKNACREYRLVMLKINQKAQERP